MAHDVCRRLRRGSNKAYQEFKRTRLETHPLTAQFHDKMTKKNMKPFSSIRKKPSSKTQDKQLVLKADRNRFGHIICWIPSDVRIKRNE